MRILITGAGGLVGSSLAAAYEEKAEVFPLLHRDLDISDEAQVSDAVRENRPDLIINCAVIGVDDCERDPEHAERVNVLGPRLLARAAERSNASMIHFSSNYVFSGDRSDGGFYEPEDRAEPINVYGRTKRDGERAVQAECARSWIIRTSWVFGKGKQSFLATLPAKLLARERVSAFTDIFASTTYVRDLVTRVTEIINLNDYGIYHVNNSGVCSHHEFANAAAELLGLSDADQARLIETKTAAADTHSAPRPRWSPMRCTHSERLRLPPLRPWKEALESYIRDSR